MIQELTERRIKGIRLAYEAARKIQQDFPQVEDMYRERIHLKEIVNLLGKGHC
jgi:hypothetical protein